MVVYFNDRQDIIEITDDHKKSIKKAISKCLSVENKSNNYEVSISFVTNEEIKTLNNTYRNINKETDVLSFIMDEETDGIIILGDIVISTEKASEQAKDFGHSIERELIYLVIHSMFHLLGYDHMTDDQKDEMRKKEKEVVKELKIFK